MSKVFPVDTGGTLTTSLVSYYKLSDVTDFYSTNNMTNINSATFVSGKIGNALQPARTGAKYLKKTGVISTSVNNLSVSVWVFITASNQYGGIFHNGTAGNGWGLGVATGVSQAAGSNRITVYTNNGTDVFAGFIGTGWHHLVVSKGVTTWKAYVDGTQSVTTTTTNVTTPLTSTQIGAILSSTPDYSDFPTDEVVFWNKELTQQEVTDLYNGGTGQSMTDTPPTVTTGSGTALIYLGATLNATVNANEVSTTITFEYGLTTSYGTTVTATQSPVTGTTTTAVSKTITGLADDTTYHFRCVGVSRVGTTNGLDGTFRTYQQDSNAMFMTNENVDTPTKITVDCSDSNAIFME